jgi:hypothetical protein
MGQEVAGQSERLISSSCALDDISGNFLANGGQQHVPFKLTSQLPTAESSVSRNFLHC